MGAISLLYQKDPMRIKKGSVSQQLTLYYVKLDSSISLQCIDTEDTQTIFFTA